MFSPASQPLAFVFPFTSIAVAAVAATVESVLRKRERRAAPRGRLIALRNDGRRVHVVYQAPPTLNSEPCVILEAGANGWSAMWDDVASHIGHMARVLRYDRPGFGFSDAKERPHYSIFSIASDLRAVLRAAEARPPYVFVAHSLGALYVNALLSLLHPDDVWGVVYVDAASPRTVRLLQGVVPNSSPPAWLARALGFLGVLRLLAPVALRPYAKAYDRELLQEAMATWTKGEWLLSYTAEWAAALKSVGGNGFLDKLIVPEWLGDVPIAVIVPDVYQRTDGKNYIEGLQKEVATYSRDAVVVGVEDCGHFVQIDRPDVVVEAVKSIIQRAKVKRVVDAAHVEYSEKNSSSAPGAGKSSFSRLPTHVADV